MSSEEVKRYVSAGLERRKAERNDREIQLEDQARQLRLTINDNHTARTLTEAQRKEQAEVKAMKRREAKMEARAKERAREAAATKAVRQYIMACAGILLATMLTPYPWWAFVALTAGLAVFLAVYIFRLYVPWEVKK